MLEGDRGLKLCVFEQRGVGGVSDLARSGR